MKKSLLFLPFLLLLVGAFISCEEVEEAGKYDNWRERGEAFVDSIKKVTDRVELCRRSRAGRCYGTRETVCHTDDCKHF